MALYLNIGKEHKLILSMLYVLLKGMNLETNKVNSYFQNFFLMNSVKNSVPANIDGVSGSAEITRI